LTIPCVRENEVKLFASADVKIDPSDQPVYRHAMLVRVTAGLPEAARLRGDLPSPGDIQ